MINLFRSKISMKIDQGIYLKTCKKILELLMIYLEHNADNLWFFNSLKYYYSGVSWYVSAFIKFDRHKIL